MNCFKNIPQFYYMGELDDNDPFASLEKDATMPKYDSAITREELTQLHSILGQDMQKDRWINTQKIYHAFGVNAEFRTYKGYGHTSKPAQKDLIKFIENQLDKNKNNTKNV